mmetsp:Transcript_32404/g.74961  ORF Transcript_32404/g.74961 Transcript_32404/m.74961 type:complete len:408 (+) Transcript_32404:334-1557(+)
MMSLGQVAMAVVAAILIPVVLHFWTQGVHKRTRAPNWSLLHMFNCLILFLFLLSTFQMFRTRGSLTRKETPAGYLSIWGLIICVTLVYFFSVFGVALTHLVLEDDDYHPNGVMPQRESDDVLSAKNIERSSSPPLPGDSSCTACSDSKGHTHSACAHSGGGANGEASGRVSQQYPNTLESLEVLRSVNERVATANSVADVWGQGAILWGLTNSDSVTVDMLRETQIGRTVGQFTKRNCAKCGTCEWCLLMAKWRKMAVKEMKIKAAPCTVGDGCSSHPTSGGGGGGGGGGSGAHTPVQHSQKVRSRRGELRHRRLHSDPQGLPSIPEATRPHAESRDSESEDSEWESDARQSSGGRWHTESCSSSRSCPDLAGEMSRPIQVPSDTWEGPGADQEIDSEVMFGGSMLG